MFHVAAEHQPARAFEEAPHWLVETREEAEALVEELRASGRYQNVHFWSY